MTNKLNSSPKHYCGATKRRGTSKAHKIKFANLIPQISHWGAFIIGILVGSLISCIIIFGFFSNTLSRKAAPKLKEIHIAKKNVAAKSEEVVQEKATVTVAKAVKEPRYDFYTELTGESHGSDKSKANSSQVLDLKSPPKPINKYVVQAGSFKNRADADALKARLTLNGLAAKIEVVKLNEEEYWHRVIMGPFQSEAQAAEQKQLVKNLEVDAILVLKSSE